MSPEKSENIADPTGHQHFNRETQAVQTNSNSGIPARVIAVCESAHFLAR
jgi:hypothetical protein